MKVTIVGTGRMARAIASRAVAGGHEVEFIGTHISKAQQLADEMIGEGSVEAADLVHGDLFVLAVRELIEAEAPADAAFVKAFNTNFAGPLLAGEVDGEPLDVFIAGDDDGAKARVMRLVSDGGMRAIDAGRLVRARELEAMALLHMEIQGSQRTAFGSAIKVVP